MNHKADVPSRIALSGASIAVFLGAKRRSPRQGKHIRIESPGLAFLVALPTLTPLTCTGADGNHSSYQHGGEDLVDRTPVVAE
jgi:hypothetical protein